MINLENILIALFSALFLYRVRYAFLFLVVLQFLFYFVPQLQFVSFFIKLPPIVTLLYFGSLLFIKLHRSSIRAGSIPEELKVVGFYLFASALIVTPLEKDMRFWSTLPVLCGYLICITALLQLYDADKFEDIVSSALVIVFLMLFAGFALELVLNRSLSEILGVERRIYGTYAGSYWILHGLLGNSNESTGALVTLLPMFYLFSHRYRWLKNFRLSNRYIISGIVLITMIVSLRSHNMTGIVALCASVVLLAMNRPRYIAYFATLALVSFFVFVPNKGGFADVLALKVGWDAQTSLGARVYEIWLPHLEVWSDSLRAIIMGYGPDSWPNMMVGQPVWSLSEGKVVPMSPHNIWVYFLFTQGLLGVVVFGYIYFRNLLRALKLKGLEKRCYLASLASFFIWSFFANVHRAYGIIILLSLCFLIAAKGVKRLPGGMKWQRSLS